MNEYRSLDKILRTTKNRFWEITKYLNFLEQLESKQNLIKKTIKVDVDVITIQKSTLFLMLYNIIEYSVYAGVYHIYYCLQKKNFNKLSNKLKERIVSDLIESKERSTPRQLVWLIKKIEIDVNYVWANCKKDNRAGLTNKTKGNVDAYIINTILDSYGIDNLNTMMQSDWNNFNAIKEKRNALSHGSISFSDSRNTTVQEIKHLEQVVEGVVYDFFSKIKRYKLEKKYLELTT